MSLLRTVRHFAKPKLTQKMAAAGPKPLSARSKGGLGGSYRIEREHRCEHPSSQLAKGLFYLMTRKNASENIRYLSRPSYLSQLVVALSRERFGEAADKSESPDISRQLITLSYASRAGCPLS